MSDLAMSDLAMSDLGMVRCSARVCRVTSLHPGQDHIGKDHDPESELAHQGDIDVNSNDSDHHQNEREHVW